MCCFLVRCFRIFLKFLLTSGKANIWNMMAEHGTIIWGFWVYVLIIHIFCQATILCPEDELQWKSKRWHNRKVYLIKMMYSNITQNQLNNLMRIHAKHQWNVLELFDCTWDFASFKAQTKLFTVIKLQTTSFVLIYRLMKSTSFRNQNYI